MRRFLFKVTLIMMVNVGAGLAVLALHDARLKYTHWETDSVLLTTPRNTAFDVAFLGSSHAYLFSRLQKNHEVTERVLGLRLFNLGLPTGGGIRPARFMLENFHERGNTVKQVVYFLDPFVFFSTGANDSHKFIYFEPLQFPFLKKMILDRYPLRSILTYIRSKFTYDWFFQHAEPLEEQTYALDAQAVQEARIHARMDSLYGDGLREENFLRYAGEMKKIIDYCKANGMVLHVIVPPTLLGPEPGAARMFAWLEEQKKAGGLDVRDCSGALPDPKYYYNLDHLNTAGVERFMRDCVKPVLVPRAD